MSSGLRDIKSATFLTTYKWLCVEILFLIALGGSVRAMNAGLACPDWPLCFGDFIPDYHPQVYLEFLHRVLAGFVAIVSTYLNIQIFKSTARQSLKWLAAFITVLLFAQVILGGLTVLMQLQEYIVAAHLGLGTLFFVLSLWVYLTLKMDKDNVRVVARTDASTIRWGAVFQVLFVFGQIMLGGLVASHYAAQVCTEFPLCHGSLVPTLSGVIGLHVIHRLGAYFLTAYTLFYCGYLIFRKLEVQQYNIFKKPAIYLLAILALQIVIGIANVIYLTPPLITVLHLVFGTITFGAAVYILRQATYKPL